MEAVQFVTRHVRRPAWFVCSPVTWAEAKAVLWVIADLSNPSGSGCRASQATLGEIVELRRQRVNELIQVLLEAKVLEKEHNSRRYIIPGVQDHDPTACGHAWCEKEARTVFRTNRKGRSRPKPSQRLATAAEEAAFMADWYRQQEAAGH